MRSHHTIALLTLITLFMGLGMTLHSCATVIRENEEVFLVDLTGERWDITQAVSIGFEPHRFQFGLGRNTIQPLDEASLENNTEGLNPDARVIGIENGSDARAYVVSKLRRHEVANTRLGEEPVAAAY